ncbi:hypothetical protein J6590_062338 [Homalodisca vitripennis]|nr:hypothetical protein J6590_062338 [Homalodisca vitripennis]
MLYNEDGCKRGFKTPPCPGGDSKPHETRTGCFTMKTGVREGLRPRLVRVGTVNHMKHVLDACSLCYIPLVRTMKTVISEGLRPRLVRVGTVNHMIHVLDAC